MKYFDGNTILLDNKNSLTFPGATILQVKADNNSQGINNVNYEVTIASTTPGLPAVLAVDMTTGGYDIQSPDGGISGSLVANDAGAGFYSGFYTYGMHIDTSGLLTGNSIDTILTQSSSYKTTVFDGINTTDLTMDLSGLTLGYTNGTNISSYSSNATGLQIQTTDIVSISGTKIDFQDISLHTFSYFDMNYYQFFVGVPNNIMTGNPQTPLMVSADFNAYASMGIQNKRKGDVASTDIVASNDIDDGTESTGHYIDMGINSSVWGTPNALGGANDGYLYVNNGGLFLGTSKSHDLIFGAGGTATSNIYGRFLWNQPTLRVGSTVTTGKYQILSANTKIFTLTADSTSLNNWSLTVPNDVPAVDGYILTAKTSGVSQWSKNSLDSSLLSDVSISSPLLDQYLRFNGSQWVNAVGGTTSAGAGVSLFFSNASSGISTYETISQTPDTGAEQDESITVSGGTPTAFEAYSTTVALNRTTIDAGIWNFNTYCYVNNPGGTSYLTFQVYKRASGGTETLLFSVNTPSLTNTSVELITVPTVQPAYTILATDLLVIKVLATSTISRILHFVHSGTTHYSNIETPLVTLHNSLAGLQGGTSNEFYHLTSAEYTGIGTGNFVRTSSPTITTPVLTGLPTGTGVASASTASTLVSRDANGNIQANNYLDAYATTATATGTTTLTVSDKYYQFFTGTLTQDVVLPDATTLALGHRFHIDNNSTSAVTIKTNGGATLIIVAPGTDCMVVCTSIGSSAGTWDTNPYAAILASGKILNVSNSLTLAGTDGTTMTFPTTSKTVASNDGTNWAFSSQATGDIAYATSSSAYGRLAIGASTTVLHGGTTPSYSQIVNGDIANGTIDLTTKVTGVLPKANGGMDTSTYYTLAYSACSITAAVTVNTFMLIQGSGAGVTSGTASATLPTLIYINSADYPTVNGLAPKLRIRAWVKTNGVAPTCSFTFGLYPITAGSGGAGLSANTIGSVVTGSATGTVTTPALGTNTQVSSSDFALPANGIYALCVVTTTATTAASSYSLCYAELQLHNA